MTQITLKGNIIHTIGALPKTGDTAPEFQATDYDLNDVRLSQFFGKKIILNVFPSLDTATCANTMHRFNELAMQFSQVIILPISADLPFAQQRFCSQQNIQNIKPLSVFRFADFGQKYGLIMTDGPLRGLLARAVIAINEQNKIIYSELVKELVDEPNYSGLISAIQKS